MIAEKSLPNVLESKVFIRFQDCDPFGHLNNARYADYFMDARFEQMVQTYRFNLFAEGKAVGKNWVVSKAQIAYLRPVQFMETVQIKTRLIHFTTRQLTVEGLMFDSEGEKLRAVSWMGFTLVDLKNGRSATHESRWMELYEAVCVPNIYDAFSFDERVGALKEEHRKRP